MVVFVCEDIIKSLGNTNDPNHEHAVRIFNEVSLASLRCKHYVLIENFLSWKINKIIEDTSSEKTFLSLKQSNTSKSLSILGYVNVVLAISFQNINRLKSQPWYDAHSLLTLDPSKNKVLEVFEETHLLTENLNDGLLFKEITNRQLKKKKLSSVISISFFNRLGGGNTICDVYDQEKKSGEHLCVTIVDSDKKHPTGKEGDTATELRKHLDAKWIYSDHHIMKDLSEIENLLPIKFYKSKSNVNLLKRLSKIDLSFYDLKCGLTADIVKETDGYNYWKAKGIALPPIVDIQKIDNKHQIMPGVGSQSMTNFLKRKGYKGDVIGIKDCELSINQSKEYHSIANLIFNWCISSPPLRS